MVDYTAVASSLITGAVTALGTILGFISTNKAQKKKNYEEHKNASKQLQESIERKLDTHRKEYLDGIYQVNQTLKENSEKLSELRHQHEMSTALTEQKIAELSERVEKHNQVVERTYKVEKDISVLMNRESVSEHRLKDIEDKLENKVV